MGLRGPALAVFLLISSTTNAAEGYDFYVGAIGGLSVLNGIKLKQVDLNASDRRQSPNYQDIDFDPDAGWAGGAVAGYRSTAMGRPRVPAVRFELEYGHTQNDAKSISTTNAPSSEKESDGAIKTDTLLLNLVFELQPVGAATPFLGLGAGAVRFEVNDIQDIDDADIAPAAQVIAGLDFTLTERLAFGVRYRGRWQGDVRLESQHAYPAPTATGFDSETYYVDVETGTAHGLTGMATLRF